MTRKNSYKLIKKFCDCGNEAYTRCDICGTITCAGCLTYNVDETERYCAVCCDIMSSNECEMQEDY